MDFPKKNSPLKTIPTDLKSNLKLQDERNFKVKKLLFTFIQDNNVELVTDDQVRFEGKDYSMELFAERLKWTFEGKHKNLPIISVYEYVRLLREISADNYRMQELLSYNMNSKFMTEEEILGLVSNPKLEFSKSLEQAKEFLSHILFRIPDNSGAIKVVAKKYFEIKDEQGIYRTLEKEVLLPGFKNLRDYEETLKHIPVKSSIIEKPESYWDVFVRSKAVVQASMTYNPYKELYWCDEFKHHYINTYKEPLWKEYPDYYHLMQQHKNEPLAFNQLSPVLRSFLKHLIPKEESRREVLKWCAFSTQEKLQTYLTLIGAQGIGKTLLVESLLGYYHGEENIHFPSQIGMKFNAKNAISTLLYFDEKSMVSVNDYNEMKTYINTKLSFEEKGKPVFMAENFANIVWSCNNKDSMSGMSREDRRFKIIPLTNIKLLGAPIYDSNDRVIGKFTTEILKELATTFTYKKEFVRLMLSLRDHISEIQESKNDINSINDNETRDEIFSESRSLEFTEIIDVLKNVFIDYNPITEKWGSKPMTSEEKENLGLPYEDYIPLSKLIPAKNDHYTYRVPFAVIRRVISAKAGKNKPMSFRSFNRHLENMPPKFLKGFAVQGVMRDVEIFLHGDEDESHEYFEKNYMPLLINKGKKKHKINDEFKEEFQAFMKKKAEDVIGEIKKPMDIFPKEIPNDEFRNDVESFMNKKVANPFEDE